jgi:methyltransferase family protein
VKKLIIKGLKNVGNVVFQSFEPKDLKKELQRMATQKTAEYIRNNMIAVQSVSDVYSVHNKAIDKVTINNGLVLEFGVFSGNSINHIASRRDWTVDGFDSFEGLPESWRDGFEKGHFKLSSLPKVRANVRLHKGRFDESIPKFLRALDNKDLPIAYLHIDCDLYSSTKTIFEMLGVKIKPGTVIVFDEYFNYVGWEDGEFLAFKEFVESKSIRYEYITYNSKDEQVAVLIK